MRAFLSETISESDFKIWIDPLGPVRVEGKTLYIGCPNRFFMSWVKEHYFSRLLLALETARGEGRTIFDISLEIAPAVRAPRRTAGVQAQSQPELPSLDLHHAPPLRFNQKFTFDRFVVGATNQYAYSAAQAVALGQDLNTDSLLLLADPGLGKSHLSQAIGHQVLAQDRRKKVFYLTAEDFTNEMVYSIKNRCVEDFKDKYRRGCDVLVLEEIHFLSGKEKVQTELSYTLDCLAGNRKKIILTSSRLPKDIPRLGRQFASRLNNSLISAIGAPDFETRRKIVERKAAEMSLNACPEVIEYISDRVRKDVRQMESCLNSLSAKSRLLGRPIDLRMARESLADLLEDSGACTLEDIQKLICRQYQLSLEDIKSASRKKNIVLPRNLGMYLCRSLTEMSLQEIGRGFGRNHSTVLYSVNNIDNQIKKDNKIKAQLEFLTERLVSGQVH
ncbi:MAG: chromosomal replication initiator protein DnaA [Pseudomonadota bacterium]